MWSREILKSNAKIAIRGKKFWVAFLLVAAYELLPAIVGYVSGYDKINSDFINAFIRRTPMPNMTQAIGFNFLYLIISILILTPIFVGLRGFFVRNHFDAGKPSDFLMAFRGGYGNVVLASFVTNLFISLWSLLLLVPGIIKTFEYYMVPFLLSDNPKLSGKRAREISRKMTDGEKGAIIVLLLSFIGWFLLLLLVGAFFDFWLFVSPLMNTIGQIVVRVGNVMIMVYVYATFAELYLFLRDRAIQTGMVQPEELGL